MRLEERIARAEKRAQHYRRCAGMALDEALGCENLGFTEKATRLHKEAKDLEEGAKIWDATAEVLREQTAR